MDRHDVKRKENGNMIIKFFSLFICKEKKINGSFHPPINQYFEELLEVL